jgi:hypothetical protein
MAHSWEWPNLLITETLQPRPAPEPLFSDSALKVVFTTLYVDVKEPVQPVTAGLKSGFGNFFSTSKLKTVVFAFFLSMVGLTGLEPVTLRLSSACSNQLSYRPGSRFAVAIGGGKGIRTPDL